MSNFIYNDNFNGGDKEPIQFNFDAPRKGRGKAIAITCIICGVALVLVYILLGMWMYNSQSEGDLAPERVEKPNVVYTNTVIQSSDISPVKGSTAEGGISRAEMIEQIRDTVVEIRTQSVVSQNQYIKSGAGSGVIVGRYEVKDDKTGEVTERGYHIITNAHVIEDSVNSGKITVTLTDGTEYTASPIGADSISDIAVLKIKESKELKCATFASNDYQLRVGDDVIAIGNPLGQLGGTVTNGYISALDREIEIDGNVMTLLQTDAPINPGNSGGGLFNLRGELVGIVNAKSTGTDIEGIGFAIPAADAFAILEDFISLGYVENRPTLFIECLTYQSSVVITQVLERETGDNSELLKKDDIIKGVYVDGEAIAVTSASQLISIVNSMEIGDELTLVVQRKFRQYTVTVTLYEYYI